LKALLHTRRMQGNVTLLQVLHIRILYWMSVTISFCGATAQSRPGQPHCWVF
jgi:hypothetical protein